MVTTYVLFAIFYSGNGNSTYQADFNSQGACIMALEEGKRERVFDNGMCVPKG
uniref:Uncharacterized protein n=1 Tax=Klebsiella phage FKP3 TaxID=3231233 RepID=A0AAU8HZU1_9CAUD